MRRTEEQWDDLANKILRGDFDLEVLNDNTDVSGLQDELATLRAENASLKARVKEIEDDVFDLACEMREMGERE